jgi:peptidyl-prolyl cis-trans isomerase SurA
MVLGNTSGAQVMDVNVKMPDTSSRHDSFRRWFIAAAVAAALALPGTALAQVVVVANGSPITELDIQQRTRMMASATRKRPSRKEVIQDLIDDRLKIAKAKVYGLVVGDDDVENAFENMAQRQGLSKQQFAQYLERNGISPAAVKARLRAQITWNQLVRGKYSASLQIGDADISRALRQRNESEDAVGYVYTLYPVTVVVPRGASQSVLATKRREAENLRSRFTSCSQGLALARAVRDVAVNEPIAKSSAALPEPLRDLLDKMQIGHLTTPEVTAQGLQMFALCDKKQTTTESPLKRKVRNELFAKRFEAESKKYLEEIRKSAMIEYK